jgi:hypothetical protein
MTPDLKYMQQLADRQATITRELLEKDPSLGITAYIMAGDQASAERWTELVKTGLWTPERAVHMVGSFARLDWAIEHCPPDWVIENLPELWVGSDPDDTKLGYKALWQQARYLNGAIICDGEPLPAQETYRVYRGQRASEVCGLSWTLDREIAAKFARGAGVRRYLPDGVVLTMDVHRDRVMAYLTGRGESEVIVDFNMVNPT